MKKFATLGPEGTNHVVNARRYIAFHDLRDAKVVCVPNFDEAFDLLAREEVDFVIQACLHPEVPDSIGRHHSRFPLVDVFQGLTAKMGVLTDKSVAQPRSLGLMPTTRVYFDASRWPDQVELPSTSEVALQLLDGSFDSGFTDLDLALRHPGRFRVDLQVGPVNVAWLVYGRAPVCHGIVADKYAPVVAQFAKSQASDPVPLLATVPAK